MGVPRLGLGHQTVTPRRARGLLVFLCVASLLPVGCAWTKRGEVEIDEAVYRRAQSERTKHLEDEVERLRLDLRRAEEALVTAESGLRGNYTRADAISTLAEARIQVERAWADAPWRRGEIAEARSKLHEADDQIQQGHFGAALFFVYRAQRIAERAQNEVREARSRPGTRFVRVKSVNLRAGPSTEHRIVRVLGEGTPVFPEGSRSAWLLVRAGAAVGWVHQSLLSSD